MTVIFLSKRERKKLMAALANLTKAITDLTTAVGNIPQAGTGATETEVQAAADAVTAQTARIVTLTTPPPAAAPAPTP